MKGIHLVFILGGAAVAYHLATKKKSSDALRQKTRVPHSGAFELRTDPSGGEICVGTLTGEIIPMRHCKDPASALEGYFSTGALASDEYRTSYDHGHDHTVPCCAGCAQGRGCSG
jgi:hypothetical protein